MPVVKARPEEAVLPGIDVRQPAVLRKTAFPGGDGGVSVHDPDDLPLEYPRMAGFRVRLPLGGDDDFRKIQHVRDSAQLCDGAENALALFLVLRQLFPLGVDHLLGRAAHEALVGQLPLSPGDLPVHLLEIGR